MTKVEINVSTTEELVDAVQGVLISSRIKHSIDNSDEIHFSELEKFINKNLAITENYLKTAEGAFKEHLEMVVKKSHDILRDIEYVRERTGKTGIGKERLLQGL